LKTKLALLGIFITAWGLAQTSSPAEKGGISGSVINVAGEALRRATVRLTPTPSGLPTGSRGSDLTTETDSQGNFAFDEIAPGRYSLSASRAGYIAAIYSTPRGYVLTMAPGQKMAGVVLKLTPQSIIAGRVIDEDGEPMPGTTVSILRAAVSRDGQTSPAPLSSFSTDADGAFAIRVGPGRYFISAAVAQLATPVPTGSSQRPRRSEQVYVTMYYPEATDISAASAIDIAAGAELRGLEIRLRKVPVFRVSGKVVNAVSDDPGSSVARLNLIPKGSAFAPNLAARSTGLQAGEFEFDQVLPGVYILETTPDGSVPALVGRQIISVGNADLDRVVVEMKPGIELRGRVLVEGNPLAKWPQIALMPVEGLNYPSDFAEVNPDGSFALAGLEPAPYRVSVGGVRAPQFIKSIRYNVSDAIQDPIDLASSPNASLEIVISDKASAITGVVHDSTGATVPLAVVMAVQPRGVLPSSRTTLADENGRFSVTGLRPGDYLIAAMDSGNAFLQIPPEMLEKLGTAVKVGEGVTATADPRLITLADIH